MFPAVCFRTLYLGYTEFTKILWFFFFSVKKKSLLFSYELVFLSLNNSLKQKHNVQFYDTLFFILQGFAACKC